MTVTREKERTGKQTKNHINEWIIKTIYQPWLVWLIWFLIPFTKRTQVPFPVRACPWVVGLVPDGGMYKRQPINISLSQWCFSLSLSPLLPLALQSISMFLGEDKKITNTIIKLDRTKARETPCMRNSEGGYWTQVPAVTYVCLLLS